VPATGSSLPPGSEPGTQVSVNETGLSHGLPCSDFPWPPDTLHRLCRLELGQQPVHCASLGTWSGNPILAVAHRRRGTDLITLWALHAAGSSLVALWPPPAEDRTATSSDESLGEDIDEVELTEDEDGSLTVLVASRALSRTSAEAANSGVQLRALRTKGAPKLGSVQVLTATSMAHLDHEKRNEPPGALAEAHASRQRLLSYGSIELSGVSRRVVIWVWAGNAARLLFRNDWSEARQVCYLAKNTLKAQKGAGEEGCVVDVAASKPMREGLLAVGLLAAPPKLIVWQVRKLQVVFVLPLLGLADFGTLALFTLPVSAAAGTPEGCSRPADAGSQQSACSRSLVTSLDEVARRTPPLPADTSAWNTLCEGPCEGLRELGCLAFADPLPAAPRGGRQEKGGAPRETFLLVLAGGGRQPGQAHLLSLKGHENPRKGSDGPDAQLREGTRAGGRGDGDSHQGRSLFGLGSCAISLEETAQGPRLELSDGASRTQVELPIPKDAGAPDHPGSSECGGAFSRLVCANPSLPFLVVSQPGGSLDVLLANASTPETQ